MITPIRTMTINQIAERKDDLLMSNADIEEMAKNVREKAIDKAIEKFLEYGCVCVEWNKELSKEKLVDDVLRQAMGQVVYILEKMKAAN